MAGPVAFVGREGELSRLVGVLGGDARLVLVTGDAGVGKTRLVGEGMARAAAGGMVIARGECLPVAGTLPLLPVASALGELAGLDGGRLWEAALGAAPGFVRAEVGRLVPQLGAGGGPGVDARGEGWQRERLFSGVAQLLGAVVAGAAAGVGLVVEDVHWADSETLDFLTFLSRAGQPGAVRVVVTCRSDEAPVAAPVAGWLAQARGVAAVEEITLGPLSRPEVAGQAAALAGGPVPPGVVDELFARAEGNPFFTEQLVTAALAGGAAGGGLRIPAGLPGRLAGLLAARAGRCAGEARAVLDVLAVAGRPLGEDLLGHITGLEAEVVRRGLRELAAARLLADDTAPGGGNRPRHALLAEAVAEGLLPGERVALHERTARALDAAGGGALAAEVAGHWQAAGRPAEELPARVAAAGAAERVFGFAEAATHWQRAIELCPAVPGAVSAAGVDVPNLYLRGAQALEISGDTERAGDLAEEAYRRFSDHPDPVTAAAIHWRAGHFRAIDAPDAGLPLIREALRLFEAAPPSADQAEAWYDYAHMLFDRQPTESLTALNQAMEIANAAHATSLIPLFMSTLAVHMFLRGQIAEGFAILDRGRAMAESSGAGAALPRLAVIDSDARLKTGKFESATEVALRGLDAAWQTGRQTSFSAAFLAANAAEALIARGHTGEAAVLIDPLTAGPPDRDHWFIHQSRAELDMLRGDMGAATTRQQQISDCIGPAPSVEWAREAGQRAAELALWAERPGDALDEVRRALPLFKNSDMTIFCGRLLAVGMRACADLAEQARARRRAPAAQDAVAAAGGLASWSDQMGGAPFADHPFVATIPAERATWDAERTRLAGASDPAAWGGAAKAWQDLSCPYRAGYAWWRQAQAQLDAGQPSAAAAAALQAAAAAADGHQPLLAQVAKLAGRARIPLLPPGAAVTAQAPPLAQARVPYGLTGRELAVLRLLAAGRSNAQIGAELFISRRTAGVHVTNILRKLGVSGRVRAAAVAERAGLLEDQRS
jgi:DNA-binding CsgD family transcriptional regulator/tetratricopeptide (TPR) repeat protein